MILDNWNDFERKKVMDRGNELLKESVVMANELDVAGEFIYAAIDKFN